MKRCSDSEKMTADKKIEIIRKELKEDIDRWNYLREHGGSDPFWPDGVNMNLKRNHIIHDLMRLEELDRSPRQITVFALLDPDFSEAANSDLVPPVVPDDYMANDRKCLYFSHCEVRK